MLPKEASAMIYLTEELGDARLLCDQLQRYVERAVKLVEQSGKKDHFFEVAGDLIQSIPETTAKLNKALQAVALATNRLDYEEVKQELSPEKVDELETVLEDVRIRPVRRRGNLMTPEQAVQQLRSLAAKTRETGMVPITAALGLINNLDVESKTDSADPAAEFEVLAAAMENPPEGAEPSRERLATVLRHVVAKALSEDAVLAHRVAARSLEAKSSPREDGQVSRMEDSLKAVEAEMQKMRKALDRYKKNPTKNAPQVTAFESALSKAKHLLDSYERYGALRRASDEEKEGKFEEGKPADPTKNMSEEDAKKWKENVDHDGSNIKKEANDKAIRAMDKVVRTIEGNLKTLKASADKYKSDPRKYAPQLDNFADDVRAIASAIRVFNRQSGKTASVEKIATSLTNELETSYVDGYDEGEYSDPKVAQRDVKSSLSKLADAAKKLADLASKHSIAIPKGEIRGLSYSLENFVLQVGTARGALAESGKTASDEEKEGKFEEGKPADPTKNMSPEDAKKWKENVDHDGSNIKDKKASDEEKEGKFEEGKPADPTKNMSPEDAKKWKENVDHDGSNIKDASGPFDKIRPGAEVTIADRRGKKQTGEAKKKTPAGWMVDVDGKEVMATPDNTVNVKTAADWKVAFGGVGTWFRATPHSDGYTDYFYAFDTFANGALKGMRVGVGPSGRTLAPKFESLRGVNLPIVHERDVPKKVQDRAFAAVKEYRAKAEQAAAKLEEQKQQMDNVRPPATPTKEEIMTLLIMMGTKPSYRGSEMARKGLGDYGLGNIHINSLIKRGVLTVRGGKSILIDKRKALALLSKVKSTIENDEKVRSVVPFGLLNKL